MVLAALERSWRKDPDQRFGQFMFNFLRRNWTGDDYLRVLSHIEDGQLLEVLGIETEQEQDYARREPADRDQAWKEWQSQPSPGVTAWLNTHDAELSSDLGQDPSDG
jgi:hypothetical protein